MQIDAGDMVIIAGLRRDMGAHADVHEGSEGSESIDTSLQT